MKKKKKKHKKHCHLPESVTLTEEDVEAVQESKKKNKKEKSVTITNSEPEQLDIHLLSDSLLPVTDEGETKKKKKSKKKKSLGNGYTVDITYVYSCAEEVGRTLNPACSSSHSFAIKVNKVAILATYQTCHVFFNGVTPHF